MKVFTCNNFIGHWPVGVAAVIIAPNIVEARGLLQKAIRERGCEKQEGFTLEEIDPTIAQARVLCDGNY